MQCTARIRISRRCAKWSSRGLASKCAADARRTTLNFNRRSDMSIATQAMNKPLITEAHEPLAARMARSVVAFSGDNLPAEVKAKVKLCLMDLIGCAFESRALPWSRQAQSIAERASNGGTGASIIGAPGAFAFGDAAFVNAVMGHGLVREDMHAGSISHLGLAVLPALLALSQYRRTTGRDF